MRAKALREVRAWPGSGTTWSPVQLGQGAGHQVGGQETRGVADWGRWTPSGLAATVRTWAFSW